MVEQEFKIRDTNRGSLEVGEIFRLREQLSDLLFVLHGSVNMECMKERQPRNSSNEPWELANVEFTQWESTEGVNRGVEFGGWDRGVTVPSHGYDQFSKVGRKEADMVERPYANRSSIGQGARQKWDVLSC